MSKFFEITEENVVLFNKVLDETSIPHWIEFKLLGNNNQKKLYEVRKLSELYEFISDGTQVVIIINEDIFDQLPDDMKELTYHELLAGIHLNDSDKILIDEYDFKTYSGVLTKYGSDEMIKYKESIISLFDKKREEEEMLKNQKKKSKST